MQTVRMNQALRVVACRSLSRAKIAWPKIFDRRQPVFILPIPYTSVLHFAGHVDLAHNDCRNTV